MRVLVTGAAGMLGTEMRKLIRASKDEFLLTDLRPVEGHVTRLDVRDARATEQLLHSFRPNRIVHMAAITDLETCELEPDDAWRTHVESTERLADWARSNGNRLIYLSTAGVFDGTSDAAYGEDDEPHPKNRYGETKLAGEREVLRIDGHGLVIRTGWMFGGGSEDKKFVAKIVRQVTPRTTELHAVVDRLGNPTWGAEVAKRLLELLDCRAAPILHLASVDFASRHDVACQILLHMGRPDVKVHEVTSDFFAAEYFAPRAKSETLRSDRLTQLGLEPMPSWRAMLKAYFAESASVPLGECLSRTSA